MWRWWLMGKREGMERIWSGLRQSRARMRRFSIAVSAAGRGWLPLCSTTVVAKTDDIPLLSTSELPNHPPQQR